MSVPLCLSFRCVVTPLDGTTPLARQRDWIICHDFYSLTVAATAQLGVRPDDCEFALFQAESPQAGVFLEVTCQDASARVGPMGGPIPPASIVPTGGYSLAELLAHLGFSPDGRPGAPDTYMALVRYASIWDREAFPPLRDPHETMRAYEARYEAVEQRRLARARHEGVHLLSYGTPLERWTAADLERVLAAMYRLLPRRAPRWRECAGITQDTSVSQSPEASSNIQCLRVARGDYAAYLRLPSIPSGALTEWMSSRRWDINLRLGAVRLEAMAMGHAANDPPSGHADPTAA